MESGGCSIYSKRPTPCREWFCVWRNLSELDDSWRPDKSGVMIEFSDEQFPGIFANRVGFRFTVINKEKATRNNKLAKFLKKQISNGVPCLLSFGIEPAQNPPVTFLNIAMGKAANQKNPNGILGELKKAITACEQQPKDFLKIEKGRIIY
jgi:hypothetical protein